MWTYIYMHVCRQWFVHGYTVYMVTDLISWLYLASRSDLQGAPVLIYNTVKIQSKS